MRDSAHVGGQRDSDVVWPQPVNLFAELAAPSVTVADVPRIIGEFADQFARAGGFDSTGAIVAAVGATAAMVDDGIRLLLPGASGHFQSARPWFAIIGPPGSGKSPTQRAALAPIFEVHRDLVAANERDRKSATSGDERIPQRALFTSDCTIDKMSELLADNPRGILYCVDEFDSWLGQHDAFSHDGGSRNRGEWMRLYDGGPHQVDRVKRGSFFVKNWGASVLTATTPAALTRLSRKLSADGLFQRFMVFAVKPMQDRDASIASFTVEQARRAYEERLCGIYAHAADLVEHPIVRLSGDAVVIYEAEEKRLRLLVEAAGHVGEGFAAHIAKHGGMLARVALTFHAASDDLLTDDGIPRHPCAVNVSGATMRLAVQFMRRAYQHAHAIYPACLGGNSPMELAKAMARSLLADGRDDFNRREITQTCRAFRDAPERLRLEALQTLSDYGWIEGDTLLPQHGGRWCVNPRAQAIYAKEGERARARRKAVSFAIRGIEIVEQNESEA